MTDRELLELAAKAAGLSHPDGWDWIRNPLGYSWNPLTDDGDAFRLMVELRLSALFPTEIGRDRVHVKGLIETLHDPLAATRLAIVRAAAEIGRSMK